MFLKSLSIQGFKSFANRTLLTFDSGLTAVVGPNGCGKSNVVDALRWVLGESSVKSLRGGEVTDVIFNGSSQRKAVSMAEVTLTLGDCESLGLSYREVAVTRRVFRDGKSEYELNKKACRLKDIQELFLDTGLGQNSYSVMEQGKIDQILSSKPEDRRAIFEEAAGIAKFKKQKQEAERKLEYTNANMLRVSDVLDEQAKRLKILAGQVGNAKEYSEQTRALKLFDLHLQHRLYTAESESSKRQETKLKDLQTSYSNLKCEIAKVDDSLHAERKALSQSTESLAEAKARKASLESKLSLAKAKGEVLEQRQQELGQQDKGQSDQMKSYLVKMEAVVKELAVAEETKLNWDARLATLNTDLLDWATKESDAREELALIEDSIEEKQIDIRSQQIKIAEYAATKIAIEAGASDIESQLDDTQSRQREHLAEVQILESEVEHSVANCLTEQKKLDACESKIQVYLNQEEQLREVQTFEQSKMNQIRDQIADVEVAVEVLRRLIELNEGKAVGAKSLLNNASFANTHKGAIVGVLEALIEVEAPFEKAVYAALEKYRGAIVVSQSEVLSEMVKVLEQQQLNGVSLLNLDVERKAHNRLSLPEGAMARAIDGVSCDESLKPLLEQLLRGVVVADSAENAQIVKGEYPDLTVVTKEGIVFDEGGVQVAPVDDPSLSLELLEINIAEQSEELERLHQNEASAVEKNQRLVDQMTLISEEREQVELELQSLQSSITIADYEKERAQQVLDQSVDLGTQLTLELATTQHKMESNRLQVTELEQTAKNYEESIFSAQQKIEAFKVKVGEANEKREGLSLKKQAAQMAIAVEKRGLDDIIQQRRPLEHRKSELEDELSFLSGQAKKREQQLLSIEADRESLAHSIAGFERQSIAVNEEIDTLGKKHGQLSAALGEHDIKLRADRSALEELSKKLNESMLAFTKSDLTLKQLAKSLEEKYSVTIADFKVDLVAVRELLVAMERPAVDLVEEEDWLGIEELVGEIRASIEEMGPVNAQAVVEYDDLSVRHQEMQGQVDDLKAAKRELEKLIKKLKSEAQARLLDTFAKVAENFEGMFRRLFGDEGEAVIKLSDEKNPLDSGVEISVKPPGKKQQSMNLLSGGERAMVAVALLFSIYQIKPAPFCVLDELDAPLDDANIEKFLQVLANFEQQSQFIVVTHHKKTMAAAALMYGVTMEEAGVSKSLSVRMSEYPLADNTSSN